ncbi:MAG: DUF1415 domain-containing protein [Bacteroidota bacterium]
MITDEKVIEQTANWIKSVVIDCNFCPFAAKALFNKSVRYIVKTESSVIQSLETLKNELRHLDNEEMTETSFLIFPNDFNDFQSYLTLVKKAEKLLADEGYNGIYQLASFHPDYCFADSETDDPANYTNRSIYPMLHILREESITKALRLFPNPEQIPQHNIDFARQKGLQYMQLLRSTCI